jgi:hypothetical protein
VKPGAPFAGFVVAVSSAAGIAAFAAAGFTFTDLEVTRSPGGASVAVVDGVGAFVAVTVAAG